MRISTPLLTLAAVLTLTSQSFASAGYFDIDPLETQTALIALKSSPLYDHPRLKHVQYVADMVESAQRPDVTATRRLAETHNFKNLARKAVGFSRECDFGSLRTPIAQQTLAQVQENFKNSLKANPAKNLPDQSNLYETVMTQYTALLPVMERELTLYEAFVKKYGAFKSTQVAASLLNIFHANYPLDVRKAIYEALTSTQFLKNVQNFNAQDFTVTRTTFTSVTAFLNKNGPIDELGLGDGTSLNTDSCGILGISREADCASHPFGLANIQAKALRIDLMSSATPDVVCDMHDADLYKAIQAFQGPGSLSKIADRSWFGVAHTIPGTLDAFALLLKSGGIFEIWSAGGDDAHAIRNVILPKGFTFAGYDDTAQLLQFKKN